MKRIKILAVVLALGALCMGVLSGCDNEKDSSEIGEGPFYTLEEAYEAGYITKRDLKSIAYYYNGNVEYPVTLNQEIDRTIREAMAQADREFDTNANADDYEITGYYGEYSGSYAVCVENIYTYAPAVIVDYWEYIGGVGIHYRGHNKIIIYRFT